LQNKMSVAVAAALEFALIALLGPLPGVAHAQTAKDLVGTWEVVANVNTATDGKKTDAFGPSPKGMAIFSADGHYMITVLRNDLPKIASNNRLKTTVDEDTAIAHGSIASYGTYSVDSKIVNLVIDQSTYPNWRGTEAKRDIVSFNGDEMEFRFVSPMGGRSDITWKRIK
jgi:Lipocalin-like domain